MQLTPWKRMGTKTFVPHAAHLPYTTLEQLERSPFVRRVLELPNAQDIKGTRAVDAALLIDENDDVQAFGFAFLKDSCATPKRYLLRAITLQAADNLAELAVALDELTVTIEHEPAPECREVLRAWWRVAHPLLLTAFLKEA